MGTSTDRIDHVTALDGLRGLCVLGPILFHVRLDGLSGDPLLAGGFFTIDVFFVLSAYLITSIALAEHAQTGRLDLRAYAGRRAEEIRAEGEARAAKYLEQMQEEPELATFLVWLDALQRSLSKNTTLILPWNAAPWHLMQPGTAAQTAAGDVPQPAAVGP